MPKEANGEVPEEANGEVTMEVIHRAGAVANGAVQVGPDQAGVVLKLTKVIGGPPKAKTTTTGQRHVAEEIAECLTHTSELCKSL